MQQTLTILKPDTIRSGRAGAVLTMIESAGFRVRAARMLHMTAAEAEGFYAVHRERPFFGDLVAFMTEGPVIVMVLEAEGAVTRLRELMGATDPGKAGPDTVRRRFGASIERNAIHGSDAPETAAAEISYFFSRLDLV
jgi:nucleoside-diphosphate kinase